MWMKLSKLIMNYKNSFYMLVNKKRTKMNFKLYIYHHPIELKNSIKYLGIHMDKELSCKIHIH